MKLVGRVASYARMAWELLVDAMHSSGAGIAPQVDETAEWPVPPQSPHTAESRALEWRPTPREKAREAAPLAGSAAERVRAARRSG